MKKILYLFTLFTLLSCEIQYDGKYRLIAKTTVVDESGNPIKDIRVDVNAGNDNISYTSTNNDGVSLQIFPPRRTEGTFSIIINPDSEIYQSKTISNIKQSDFQDYIFDLGTVTLIKNENIATFMIDLNQINQNKRIENLSINAISPEETVFYNEIPEDYYYPETYYRVLKNQTFTLFYSVRDISTSPSTLTEYTENITIGAEDLTHVIEF